MLFADRHGVLSEGFTIRLLALTVFLFRPLALLREIPDFRRRFFRWFVNPSGLPSGVLSAFTSWSPSGLLSPDSGSSSIFLGSPSRQINNVSKINGRFVDDR